MNSRKSTQIVVLTLLFAVCVPLFLWSTPRLQVATLGLAVLLAALGYLLKGVLQDILLRAAIFPLFVLAGIEGTFFVALWVDPPVTPEGYGVMAIPQLFVSLLIGSALGLGAGYTYFNKVRMDIELERSFVAVTTVVLLVWWSANIALVSSAG